MSHITKTRKDIERIIASLKEDGCPARKISKALKGDIEDGSDHAFDLDKLHKAWSNLGEMERAALKEAMKQK